LRHARPVTVVSAASEARLAGEQGLAVLYIHSLLYKLRSARDRPAKARGEKSSKAGLTMPLNAVLFASR
jgi:hypothetical protein